MIAPRNKLTAERVRALLDCNPERGTVTWRSRPGNPSFNVQWASKTAGSIDPTTSYLRVMIAGRHQYVHKIVWLHAHGWLTDASGTHLGVDRGTQANPYGPQFAYLEKRPETGVAVGFCLHGAMVSSDRPSCASRMTRQAPGNGAGRSIGQKLYIEHGGAMTRDELLADRTDDPVLTPEQFEMALRLAVAEFKAEKLEKQVRRRAHPAKHRDLMSDDTNGADEAELLAGVGRM
jgi:hypothetical protein